MGSHYGFLYFEMLSFPSSNNTPEIVFPCQISSLLDVYIYTLNKDKTLKTINFSFSSIFCNLLWSKFWNHLQAEITPLSPMFFDFLTVFHMVWKSQENCESWLVRFWVSRHSQMPKISVNIFLFHFWAPVMDLLTAMKS